MIFLVALLLAAILVGLVLVMIKLGEISDTQSTILATLVILKAIRKVG